MEKTQDTNTTFGVLEKAIKRSSQETQEEISKNLEEIIN